MIEAFQICTKDTVNPSHEGQWKKPAKPKNGNQGKGKRFSLTSLPGEVSPRGLSSISENRKCDVRDPDFNLTFLEVNLSHNTSYTVLHKRGQTAASYLPRVLAKVWGQVRATPSAGLVCRVSSRPETWRWPSELSVHPAPETSFYKRENQHQINDGGE